MYLKLDFAYKELSEHIRQENIELYNKIWESGQADNFCLLIEDKLGTPTPEKLNYFMQTHKEWIEKELKLS